MIKPHFRFIQSTPQGNGGVYKLNQTVEGVAAVYYGILYKTHYETPMYELKRSSDTFSIFINKEKKKELEQQNYQIVKIKLPTFMDIYQFIHSLFRRAQVEPECLIASVVYLERLIKSSPLFKFTLDNWEKVVFVSIMIASKAWDDISCSTKSFCPCGNGIFSRKELVDMERIFLERIGYSLVVTAETYRVFYYDMKKIWVNIKIDDKV